MPVIDIEPFKQIHLDFSAFPDVCWIERIPTNDRPHLCKVSTFDRDSFIGAIVHSKQTLHVTKRIAIADIMASFTGGFGFLMVPTVFRDMEFGDLDSKITLAALSVSSPRLMISVIEVVPDTYDEDYERAMKVVR